MLSKQSVTSLSIEGVPMKPQIEESLRGFLSKNQVLRDLSVSGCSLSDEG